jgi:hypothetical protein
MRGWCSLLLLPLLLPVVVVGEWNLELGEEEQK